MHDASEAYISDITRPVKQELSQYLEMEQHLQQFIYTVYGLSDLTQYECSLIKEIDDDMLAYEMRLLLHSHEVCNGELIGQHNFQFVMMKEVEDEFVRLVKELQNKLSLTSTMESLSTP